MSLKQEIKQLQSDVGKSKAALNYWGSDKQFQKFKDRVDRRINLELDLITAYEKRLKAIETRMPNAWKE